MWSAGDKDQRVKGFAPEERVCRSVWPGKESFEPSTECGVAESNICPDYAQSSFIPDGSQQGSYQCVITKSLRREQDGPFVDRRIPNMTEAALVDDLRRQIDHAYDTALPNLLEVARKRLSARPLGCSWFGGDPQSIERGVAQEREMVERIRTRMKKDADQHWDRSGMPEIQNETYDARSQKTTLARWHDLKVKVVANEVTALPPDQDFDRNDGAKVHRNLKTGQTLRVWDPISNTLYERRIDGKGAGFAFHRVFDQVEADREARLLDDPAKAREANRLGNLTTRQYQTLFADVIASHDPVVAVHYFQSTSGDAREDISIIEDRLLNRWNDKPGYGQLHSAHLFLQREARTAGNDRDFETKDDNRLATGPTSWDEALAAMKDVHILERIREELEGQLRDLYHFREKIRSTARFEDGDYKSRKKIVIEFEIPTQKGNPAFAPLRAKR